MLHFPAGNNTAVHLSTARRTALHHQNHNTLFYLPAYTTLSALFLFLEGNNTIFHLFSAHHTASGHSYYSNMYYHDGLQARYASGHLFHRNNTSVHLSSFLQVLFHLSYNNTSHYYNLSSLVTLLHFPAGNNTAAHLSTVRHTALRHQYHNKLFCPPAYTILSALFLFPEGSNTICPLSSARHTASGHLHYSNMYYHDGLQARCASDHLFHRNSTSVHLSFFLQALFRLLYNSTLHHYNLSSLVTLLRFPAGNNTAVHLSAARHTALRHRHHNKLFCPPAYTILFALFPFQVENSTSFRLFFVPHTALHHHYQNNIGCHLNSIHQYIHMALNLYNSMRLFLPYHYLHLAVTPALNIRSGQICTRYFQL